MVIDIILTTTSTRFSDLDAKELDVLLQMTTYTGERDVYQVCPKHGRIKVNVSLHQYLTFLLTQHSPFPSYGVCVGKFQGQILFYVSTLL